MCVCVWVSEVSRERVELITRLHSYLRPPLMQEASADCSLNQDYLLCD